MSLRTAAVLVLISCQEPSNQGKESTPDADSAAPDPEVCDGQDNDGNGLIDDGLPVLTAYPDKDSDGYGDSQQAVSGCAIPVDCVADGSDCDDSDPARHPGALEVCDGQDNDCDPSGAVFQGEILLRDYLLYQDASPSRLGSAAAAAGDIDGDGREDLAIGVPQADEDGLKDTGELEGAIYLWNGPPQGAPAETRFSMAGSLGSSLSGKNGYLLAGAPTANEEQGAALLYDSDGDIVATIQNEADMARSVGATALLSEGLTANGSLEIVLSLWLDDPFTCWGACVFEPKDNILGQYHDACLYVTPHSIDLAVPPSLAVGDLTDDGQVDLLLAGNGEAEVYEGPIFEDYPNPVMGFGYTDDDRTAGASVAILPEGPTLAVGDPSNESVYLFISPVFGEFYVHMEDAVNTTFTAPGLGGALAAVDINGDGETDLLLGSEEASRVYLVFGPMPIGTVDLTTQADAVFEGSTGSGAGAVISVVGNVDGVGCSDVVIGAPDEDSVYLVPGGE